MIKFVYYVCLFVCLGDVVVVVVVVVLFFVFTRARNVVVADLQSVQLPRA